MPRPTSGFIALRRDKPSGVLPYCQHHLGGILLRKLRRTRRSNAAPDIPPPFHYGATSPASLHYAATSQSGFYRIVAGRAQDRARRSGFARRERGVYDCTRPSEQRRKARDAPRDKRGKQGPRCATRQARQKKDLRLYSQSKVKNKISGVVLLSHTHVCSTIAAGALNYRVREGNVCFFSAIDTRKNFQY